MFRCGKHFLTIWLCLGVASIFLPFGYVLYEQEREVNTKKNSLCTITGCSYNTDTNTFSNDALLGKSVKS